MKEFVLKKDNHYDVERVDEDDNISIVVTILKDHAFQ